MLHHVEDRVLYCKESKTMDVLKAVMVIMICVCLVEICHAQYPVQF